MRPAHFPGRAPIDAYGNGNFRFAEMSHAGGLLCLPSGIYAWNATKPEDMTIAALERLFAESEAVEILLFGCGADLVPIKPELREALREHQIAADPMTTGAAVRTFNVLLAEDRAVAAALLPV